MKRLILLLLGFIAVLSAGAQTTLMATLSHEGQITTYYGANALVSAYNAAADGDVITLSSGQFNAVNIGKSIIIRGAGYDSDANSNRQPTLVVGDFVIGKNTNSTIEGIYHNQTINIKGDLKINFIKCRLNAIRISETNRICNNTLQLLNCVVSNYISLDGYYSESQADGYLSNKNNSAICINSIIHNPFNNIGGSFQFSNCIVCIDSSAINSGTVPLKSSFVNTFIYAPDSYSLNWNNNALSCCGFNDKIFSNQTSTNNIIAPNTDIFETFSPSCEDGCQYILTDAAKSIYIGNDGKEMGLYGGQLPFSSVPNIPQITKFNVSDKSTADGKLSIDITVEISE